MDTNLEQLLDVIESSTSSRDRFEFSSASVNTMRNHMSRLKKCGVNIQHITNENIGEALQKLKSQSNKNELSDTYLYSIINTIKKINNKCTISPKHLGINKPRNNNNLLVNYTLISDYEQLLFFAIRKIGDTQPTTDTLTRQNTFVAIILTFLTNLRSSELRQLRIEHLDMIARKEKIFIRIKNRDQPLRITTLIQFYEILLAPLKSYIEQMHNNTPNGNVKKTEGLVLTTSIDAINKDLHILYTIVMNKANSHSLGLCYFRTLNSTKCLDEDKSYLAKYLNRHQNTETSINYYNASNPIHKMNHTYEQLNKITTEQST